MTKPLQLPPLPPTIPPGVVPAERRISWHALLDVPAALREASELSMTGPLTIHALGDPPLTLERDETTQAIRGLLKLKRNNSTFGYLGLDDDDHVVILDPTGAKVLAGFNDGRIDAHNDAAVAAVTPYFALVRDGTPRAYVGLNEHDAPCILDADGTTVLAYWEGGLVEAWRAKNLRATLSVQAAMFVDIDGVQVLASQQPSVDDAIVTAGGTTVTAGGGTSVSATGAAVSAGYAGIAGADPTPKADFDSLVAEFNTLVTDVNTLAADHNTLVGDVSNVAADWSAVIADLTSVASSANTLVSDLTDLKDKFNALLVGLRTHGIIANPGP